MELQGTPAPAPAPARGMLLNILAPATGNHSNGGVSAVCTEVVVNGIIDMTGPGPKGRPFPEDCRVFAPSEHRPAAVLVLRRTGVPGTPDTPGVVMHVVPAEAPSVYRIMHGGCYVATSDSRWSRFVDRQFGRPFYGALPLHDRWEG